MIYLGYILLIENSKDFYKISYYEYRIRENIFSLFFELKENEVGKILKWIKVVFKEIFYLKCFKS